MIITVGGQKGGNGKTTLCTVIATKFLEQGKKFFVIDADKQGSFKNWALNREERKHTIIPFYFLDTDSGTDRSKMLRHTIKAYYDRVEHILIDCAGHDSLEFRAALSFSHRLVVPVRPAYFDINALPRIENAIRDVNLEIRPNDPLKSNDALIVLNLISPNPQMSEHIDALKSLREDGYDSSFRICNALIYERLVHRRAQREGKSALEMDDQKAINELEAFIAEIMDDK